MRKWQRFGTCLLGGLLCLVAVACGGGGGGSNLLDLSGSGQLTSGDPSFTDGALYDTTTFTATRNGTVTVEMNSTGLGDPWVMVMAGSEAVTYNDDGGGNLNARASFTATAGVTYVVYFSSAGAGDLGGYTWTIRES